MAESIKWDLSTIYKTDQEAHDELSQLKDKLEEVKELKNDTKENLVDLIIKNTEMSRVLGKLFAYSHMKKDEDSNVSKYQKLDKEVVNFANELSTEFSFLNPLLLSLDDEEVKELRNDERLKEHDLFLDRTLRYREYTLSDKEESVISTLSGSSRTAQQMYYFLTNSDMKFPYLEEFDTQIKNVNFVPLQQDENRELRKAVFENYYNTYNQFGNTIATAYTSHIDALVKIAKLRGYENVRSMYLYRDDVDEKVYDALIESVHSNLEYLQKYYEIKKRALGLDEQHMYDVYMSISNDFDKKYTFEEAKELVIESVRPLGEEYVENYKKAFEENWIDADIRDGKRGGAYSSGAYDTKPFILMNFNGSLDSVFTLAHELGHSLHSYYDRTSNDHLHSGYTIFVAEVASTFNEALLLDLLMKRAESKEEIIYLTDFYINNYKSTVFRQTMFAEFEREVHAAIESGQVLTKDDLSKIYHDLNSKYFGDSIVSDKEIAYEWMRIPHLYSNFYVYKYATGFSASSILAQRVLNEEDGAREKYIEFLKDGNNHFPIDQLKIAGVDMSNPEVVNSSLEIFRNLVDKLDELI